MHHLCPPVLALALGCGGAGKHPGQRCRDLICTLPGILSPAEIRDLGIDIISSDFQCSRQPLMRQSHSQAVHISRPATRASWQSCRQCIPPGLPTHGGAKGVMATTLGM